tara:strand:+ start:597 stop:2351 length:1755 start_codon:yes stop_codon:yes gene_type:complete
MIDKKNSIEDILNEFKNRAKLSDFIGQFVALTQRGNSFVGKCPFHNEKTASFSVSDDKALFYCFGCKVGGNVINFISKYKNFSFPESLKYLSNYLGIDFSYDDKQKDVYLRLYEILRVCNEFFQYCLKKNQVAYDYIFNRISNYELLKKFNVGYCPGDKDLIDFLNNKGFSLEEIEESGLLIKNKKNDFFGRFRNRIIFPIYSFGNKIVGFGGRCIRGSKVKYINSQENPIFKKSEILFGLCQNIENIRKSREIFLVEGYLDVISLFKNNIKSAVSPLGTTLSKSQISKMWSLSDTPYICFDGDEAGTNSAKKISIKVLEYLNPGKSIKFLNLPMGYDPDSFVMENGEKEFYSLKKKSKDLSEIIWEIILDSIEDHTPEFFAFMDEKIKFFSSKIRDKKVSSEYYKFLKSKKEKFIWEKNRISFKKKEKKLKQYGEKNLNEKMLIGFLLFDEGFLNEFQEEISLIELSDPKLENEKKQILEDFSTSNYGRRNEYLDFFKKENHNLYQEIVKLRTTHLKSLDLNERKTLFKHTIMNLRLPKLIQERENLKKEILNCGDNLKLNKLIKEFDETSSEIKSIRNKELE